MQLHIPEARVSLAHNKKDVLIMGRDGAIWLTGIYAEQFKKNYATHFDNSIASKDWEHPTVTLDLSMQDLVSAAH